MISASQTHLQVATRTHPGLRGKNNEDRLGISAHTIAVDDLRSSLLAVVADGIGGHQAGEIAAEITVNEISQYVASSSALNPAQTLKEALIQASDAINQQAKSNPQQLGMGATCVAAWVIEDQLFAASVGDSRLYLIRSGKIQQLTTDHTWVQEALERGIISPEEASSHPNQHIIRRYLGSPEEVVPDMRLRLHGGETDLQAEANQGFQLDPGDILVLCTDGLTDLVAEHEILAVFQNHKLNQALEELIERANERGGHDNITVIAALYPLEIDQPPEPIQQKRTKLLMPVILTIFSSILLCIVAVFVGIVFYRISNQLLGLGS